MNTTFVTARLMMGDKTTTISGPVVTVADADEAVTVLDRGDSALLPPHAWNQAEQVLRHYGCTDDHVRFQLAMARGGAGGPEG